MGQHIAVKLPLALNELRRRRAFASDKGLEVRAPASHFAVGQVPRLCLLTGEALLLLLRLALPLGQRVLRLAELLIMLGEQFLKFLTRHRIHRKSNRSLVASA